MVIQELKPSQRVSGRFLVCLEDGTILRVGESEVVGFALYTGKKLTEEETEHLLASARRGNLKEKALSLLSRKPQSRRELERKLDQWGANEEEAAAICDRMEELGYLNDESYAALIVRHYGNKGFGEKKLRDELYRRGIPRELWDRALEETADPAPAIDAFLRKKLAGGQPDQKQMQKISAALVRRGFNWSDINDALRRYQADLEECGWTE